jgi:hypothetical protein
MTVYVVQEPVKRVNGEVVPSMDLSPALAYGELDFLLPGSNISLAPAPMVRALRKKLLSFTDNDHLLAVGSPSAIATAAAVAASLNRGRFTLLQWDRREGRYYEIPVDVNGGAV